MDSRKKNILLGVLIVGVISMTIAFAALATNLRINGTANVAATKWNIRFENWEKASIPTAGGHTNTAVSPAVNELTKQDNSNVTKVSGINVTLNQPGDIAKYTFEIANRGTIAAKLDNFTATDTSQNNLINYDVKCYESSSREGTAITTNYVLGVEQKVYCYVEVSYKDQTNSQTPGQSQVYHQNATSTSVEASWTWTQANESAQSGSGSNTPASNQYWTTFDGTYLYEDVTASLGTLSEPNPEHRAFLRQNTSTNKKEACLTVSNQTVCLEIASWDCGTVTNNECSNSTGYIASKKAEIESKTGFTCTVRSSTVVCSDDSSNNSDYFELNLGAADDWNVFVRTADDSSMCYVGKTGDSYCEE